MCIRDRLHPAPKLGQEYTDVTPEGQPNSGKRQGPRSAGPAEIWYRGGDSNPYSLWPLPPQGSVSTNSTTSAKRVLLLLRGFRNVSLTGRALLLFEHRNVFDGRLLLHFKNRRIRQTCLRQIISFFFSKEG